MTLAMEFDLQEAGHGQKRKEGNEPMTKISRQPYIREGIVTFMLRSALSNRLTILISHAVFSARMSSLYAITDNDSRES